MSRLDQATTTTGQRAGRPAPSGFTLVELLVVIMIIAMLAGLVVPAVMRSQSAARNARIKAEIDMLHMAIMNYKSEYGSFPPCSDDLSASTGLATRHLQRLFPRCSTAYAQLTTTMSGKTPAQINPTNSLSFWLSGYTSDPTLPLTSGSRKKLFDFDTSRLNSSTGAYWPTGKRGSPYIYIDSGNYLTYPYVTSGLSLACAQRVPTTPPSASDASAFATASGSATSPAFANADTFQILCAGSDETFGTDDDLSNFWPGTRRDYLDSLK
jgi:prepilin-type N-terminal cleavage/methylation domain-containing protein